VILASWCGKKVVPDKIRRRPGWSEIPAVRDGRIIEIKSTLILPPGPAALTDGLDAIVAACGRYRRAEPLHRHCLGQTRRVCARERSDRSNPHLLRGNGLLRGARHRARVRATRWLAMTAKVSPPRTIPQ
jgi:hypothetical protein